MMDGVPGLEYYNIRSMTNASVKAADNSFGPFLKLAGRTTFDFTLLFEETILSIGPSALLLLLIPPRIIGLWKSPRKVTASYLRFTKIALLAIFSILQLVTVILVSQKSLLKTRASLAAALLALASAIGLCILSYFEHARSIRPSSIINAYLLLTIPFDAAQVRTRWLRGGFSVGNGILSAVLAVKLLVLAIEAVEKRSILLPPFSNQSPEATSGLYSRGMFWWLNPLFWLGFKRVIVGSDLFSVDEDLSSSSLHAKFMSYWTNRQSPCLEAIGNALTMMIGTKYPQKHTLIWITLRVMLKPLAAAVVPRLGLTFFRFMQPLLIRNITRVVNKPNTEDATNRGWGLTAAIGLVYMGLAVTTAAFEHKANRMVTMVRGSLVSAVYAQTLDLSVTAIEESAAVTLMSSDVERICEAVQPIHQMWASIIEIALAIWLLKLEIGVALLGPIFVTGCAVAGPFILGPYMADAQKSWIEGIQTRIDTTAKMLQSMKGVKMLGLNLKLSSIVRQLRLEEVTKSLKMRKLLVAMVCCGNVSDLLAPGAAFAIYVIVANINGQTLEVTSAFTTLSLIVLLVSPIRAIVFTTPPLLAAVGCFDRIEAFLLIPTQRDHRILLTTRQGHSTAKPLSEVRTTGTHNNSDIELEELTSERSKGSPPTDIRVTNLTLAWSAESSPVIDDVSFDVISGKLTMIVGPVGCGKSSLLRGLLGETPSSKGSVIIDRAHAAFVDQVPWIQNMSIRDNIIGVSAFESDWYTKVVRVCALDDDFAALAQGDGTLVGSAGAGVSGGQKLRIALARAVYSRQHVLMLDDVFSGLDATSEDRIFSRLLGRHGLLRQLGTTVILVTHAVHRLSYADHIIAINSHGTIAEQGTFPQLMSNKGYVSELTARHTTEADTAPQDETTPAKSTVTDETARINAAEDLQRPAGDWAVYKYYFEAIGLRNGIIWLGMMVSYAVLVRFPDIWIKFWTGAVAAHGNSVNGLYLGVLLGVDVIAVITLLGLCVMLFVFMVPTSARHLHHVLLGAIGVAPLSFFTSTDNGQVVNRFSQDLSVIDMELPLAVIQLSFNTTTALFQAILICVTAAYFTSVLPFVIAIMYVLQKFYLRTSRQIRLMDLEAKAPLYSNFLETLSGLVTIRAFGWTEDLAKRNMALLDASQRPFYLLYCIQRWLTLVLDLLVAALSVILVALIMRFRKNIDVGFVGVALLNLMNFNISLAEVIRSWTSIETSLGAVLRIKTFVASTGSENLIQESEDVPSDWPANGAIHVSNLSAAYTAGSAPALRNLDISISAGQKLGLCGHSGSGKSSFVSLLFHMLEITEGSVVIDGVDLSKIPRQVVRERLTVIPQEPIFLKGTIRQNLDPLDLTKDESAAEDVLQKVGLWQIVTSAGGLDVPMDADDLLSHGQRQLFCLARAMLRSSKILVLDEATASVDLKTDELMQQIIREHFKGCTIIAVAHRLQTIRDFDRIAVLEKGRIVEYGEPDVLLADQNSRFKLLWDS